MTTLDDWTVHTPDGNPHHFSGRITAADYALDAAWTDRPAIVRSPNGDEWVVIKRSARIQVQVVRVL